jgi:hypothetical protein
MKTFKQLYSEAKKRQAMSTAQRKAVGRRMSKMAKSGSFQMKKKKAALRMRDPAKLLKNAKMKVMNDFRKKSGDDWDSMSPQQRAIVDQRILQRYGAKIDKMAAKQAKILKKNEASRVKAARDALKDGN